MRWASWLIAILCGVSTLGATACKGDAKTAAAEDDPQRPVVGSWDDANVGSDAGVNDGGAPDGG